MKMGIVTFLVYLKNVHIKKEEVTVGMPLAEDMIRVRKSPSYCLVYMGLFRFDKVANYIFLKVKGDPSQMEATPVKKICQRKS